MILPGTYKSDTVCGPCPAGQYLTATDKDPSTCKNCTICAVDVVELIECSKEADTICTSPNLSATSTDQPKSFSELKKDPGLGEVEIVVIVLVIVAVFVIIIVLIICIKRRRNRQINGNRTGDKETGTTDLPTSANGAHTPLMQSWTENFICGTVFRELSSSLGSEWRIFIASLPGWDNPQRAQVAIERAREEEKNSVSNQIFSCLMKWREKCPECVNKANILDTLSKIKRADLRNHLENY